MRFGHWRGLTLTLALLSSFLIGGAAPARAGIFFHRAIPRETPAMDYRTGDVMMAPPIPYGHYAKDYVGTVQGAVGMVAGLPHGLKAKASGLLHGGMGLCGSCGGRGCGDCGGAHSACNACDGNGCSMCDGHGRIYGKGGGHFSLAKHRSSCLPGQPCYGDPVGVSVAGPMASGQGLPSGQGTVISESACGSCFGKGCGSCGGRGKLFGHGDPCGSCGGRGCGLCGRFGGRGGDPCGSCGGQGCGSCGGSGLLSGLCRGCGGAGCGLCGKAKSILGLPHALIGKLTHAGQIKYFVGPGGPVPLTPGYTPYVITTRSPRDFFAFPPFSNTQP